MRHIRWEADWGQMGSLNALACAPHSGSIVFGGYGYRSNFGTFARADGVAGTLLDTKNEPHTSRITALAYSAEKEHERVVSADFDGRVVVWSQDLGKHREIRPAIRDTRLRAAADFPIAIVGSASVAVPELVGAGTNWRLALHPLRANSAPPLQLDAVDAVHQFAGGIRVIATNSGGDRIVAGGQAETQVVAWHRQSTGWRKTVIPLTRLPLALAFLPDNRTLAIGTTLDKSLNSSLVFWDLDANVERVQLRQELKTHVHACGGERGWPVVRVRGRHGQ